MTCRIWVASLAYNKGQKTFKSRFSIFHSKSPLYKNNIIITIITIKKGSWLKSLNKSQLIPKSIYLISKYNLQNIQMIQIPQNLKILTKILNNSSQKQYFKLNLKSWRIGHRKLLQQQLGAWYLNSHPHAIQWSHSSTHLSLRTWAANLENEQ